jgi:hypothetical protein
METRKIDLTQQEMELIALCVDMMSGERNLELMEALLSRQDLAAYHTLHERVCHWSVIRERLNRGGYTRGILRHRPASLPKMRMVFLTNTSGRLTELKP